MAKKTNKTDHVLNLLAGSPEMEEESAKRTNAGKGELAGSNVQVIDSQEDEDLIANEVNRLLEEELEESEALENAGVEVAAAEPATEEPTKGEEPAAQIAEEEPETTVEASVSGNVELPEAVAKESELIGTEASVAPAEAAEAMVTEELEAAPTSEADTAKANTSSVMAEPNEANSVIVAMSELEMDDEEDADYVFVNVMGKLVKERVGEYMAEFGNCSCSRCIADTTALALIHLPPKYVVVNKNAETPLLNFYRQHYAAQITVEITKACTKVKQHPHHDRD